MKPEDVNNRKEAVLYFLQILKEKNGPVDLGDFFLNSGYTRGIDSFQIMMKEMESKGLIYINKTPSGSVPGMPFLKTNKVTYEISLDGLDYFDKHIKKKQSPRIFTLIQRITSFSKKTVGQILTGLVVTVIGGLILHNIIASGITTENSTDNFLYKPLFQLDKYKIKAENKNFPALDTLKIKVKYQGSKIVINNDFEIVDYSFNDSHLFYKDVEFNDKPSLNLLEVINPNPIVDSLNRKTDVLLEIKRKMIFDGNYMAWFEREDKQVIGEIVIAYSFKSGNETLKDTLKSDIYVEQ